MFKKWVVGILVAAVMGFGGMGAVQASHGDTTMNCVDFSTGDAVYDFWTSHGYSANNDPEGLDGNDNDGLPCEELTSGMEAQFSEYEASLGASEEDSTEETPAAEESSEDEGDALPVTATSYPTMMLFGLFTAGAGALLLFRRKTAQA